MGLLLIHMTQEVSWPFVLWPEFINSSCRQRSHGGSDDAILCYICGGRWGCVWSEGLCMWGKLTRHKLPFGRTSWRPFSTIPARAISNDCVKRYTELKNWGSLPGLSLPGSPPPCVLAPPAVTAISQHSHSGTLPQPSQKPLGVPGRTSGMGVFPIVSLHFRLIGCRILSLLL